MSIGIPGAMSPTAKSASMRSHLVTKNPGAAVLVQSNITVDASPFGKTSWEYRLIVILGSVSEVRILTLANQTTNWTVSIAAPTVRGMSYTVQVFLEASDGSGGFLPLDNAAHVNAVRIEELPAGDAVLIPIGGPTIAMGTTSVNASWKAGNTGGEEGGAYMDLFWLSEESDTRQITQKNQTVAVAGVKFIAVGAVEDYALSWGYPYFPGRFWVWHMQLRLRKHISNEVFAVNPFTIVFSENPF